MTSTWALLSANMHAKIGSSAWDVGAALGFESEAWWTTAASAIRLVCLVAWVRVLGCLARDAVPSFYLSVHDPSKWLHSSFTGYSIPR